MNEETKQYVEQVKENESVSFISKGSSLKLCMVAEHKAHIYPRFAPTMEWDIAAGQFIVEYSGGGVLDYKAQKPLEYNKENLVNPWFLVSHD